MCSCIYYIQNKLMSERVHTQLCYLANAYDFNSLITSNLENLAKSFGAVLM